ncbi:MAG: Prepilin-type N-terminal cleavage/methylation protein [Verrucomicrobiaceae bacterium]|nr:Prepilin-type N-terminal cleavage/methylation protein [Verrucomicrobiaceae bacterium]MDB6119029.1 Prepilin-type N-terminal cleavage/methylation protein [Verrucomicrobiaceae bacterium]
MNTRFTTGRKPQGMTLFEVILALALFTTAAVALVVAINTMGLAVIEARNMRAVQQGLESVVDEYSKVPQIVELDKELKPGPEGIGYRVKITLMDKLKNKDGVLVSNIYRVQVQAKWREDNRPMEMETETLRYAGMYQPMQ